MQLDFWCFERLTRKTFCDVKVASVVQILLRVFVVKTTVISEVVFVFRVFVAPSNMTIIFRTIFAFLTDRMESFSIYFCLDLLILL